jgi:hypothetical protein
MAGQAVLDPKPSIKPKFRRGDTPPARAPMHIYVTPTVPNFSVREDDAPPRPKFTRGDRLPPQPQPGLVKAQTPSRLSLRRLDHD